MKVDGIFRGQRLTVFVSGLEVVAEFEFPWEDRDPGDEHVDSKWTTHFTGHLRCGGVVVRYPGGYLRTLAPTLPDHDGGDEEPRWIRGDFVRPLSYLDSL